MSEPPEPIVELLTIGREILDGRIVDTNSVKIAEILRSRGLVPRYAQRVDDDLSRMDEAIRIAGARSDVILVTGGLGPTSDDLSAEAFALYLGEKLTMSEVALQAVADYLARFSRTMIDAQKKQALLPPSCFLLPNLEGTAPGFALERDGRSWYFMPGVPREMLRMLREQVLPRLPKREGYRSRAWITQFTAESLLQQSLDEIEFDAKPEFEITYQTRFPENHIGLLGNCQDAEAEARFEALAHRITEKLGSDVFWVAHSPSEMRTLEQVVVPILLSAGVRLCIAEQVTGGELAARFTAVADSEKVFAGAQVDFLQDHVPSESLAVEFAQTALAATRGSDPAIGDCMAIAVVGDATKMQGWIALATPQGTLALEVQAKIAVDRVRFRLLLTQRALDILRRAVPSPSR